MVRSKGKSSKASSALVKAVRNCQTAKGQAPQVSSLNTACLDFRAAAAVSEFTLEDRGLDIGKKASTKDGVKTVFAGESYINVEHRIRAAAVPIGAPLGDEAFVAESLSIEEFNATPRQLVRRLMPRRPAWSFELSSGRLHHREAQAFKQWLADIRDLIAERGGYPPAFEQNLQVWRQLWRVLERCDVAVVVVDARHPLLHLPPALVYHVARTLRKPLVVVLNKLDTVEPQDAARWAECLRRGVLGISGVVGYSKESLSGKDFGQLPVGREALIAECHKAHAEVAAAVAAGSRRPPAMHSRCSSAKEDVDEERAAAAVADGRVMLGLVGHPNVGKSSLVNSIMGGKVVSVKATPGHTKILQTLVLDDVTCLCDSPGVVFPRLEVPREAQIVGMLIPVAQVREPFSALRWVMEHAVVPLHELLGLRPATLQQVMELHEGGTIALALDRVTVEDGASLPWSPMLLCAQYAVQRGLLRSGGPDCIRAGMEILERVLAGRVPYVVRPPAVVQPIEAESHSWFRHSARGDRDSSASDDSDWQADDQDYTSEPEDAAQAEAVAQGDLLAVFGVEPLGPGSGSIQSRKRQAKKQQRLAAEGPAEDD